MTITPVPGAELTKALQPILKTLVEDMRERLTADHELTRKWKADYEAAKRSDRVASSYGEWSEDLLQQAAAGWVLTTVFCRFIEDNDLFGVHTAYISGSDSQKRGIARDFENTFYDAHPEQSYRGYLSHCFEQLANVPATEGLVEKYAAIHLISPSDDAAKNLIDFWRKADEDGTARWSFQDEELSTRFLGDMYQDLSEYARKKYALLQTPKFVEEFILDRTLEPSLEERPLKGFKVIDPTCGSGHFLLGAFWRLLEKWKIEAPGMGPRKRADLAMSAIHGVDINPFAVAISQFRLTVAFMLGSGAPMLTDGLTKPSFMITSGDALNTGFGQIDTETFSLPTENQEALQSILVPNYYDAVIGNPPYITVKDKSLNNLYREKFKGYLSGKYALTAPFMIQFFNLAKTGQTAGWVGQITSNSFMQRQFGKPLIERLFNEIDLREIIDTSGAYIPGHGTPTVILIGRHTKPSRRKIIGVLGIQGEPGIPTHPEEGKVWSSIIENIDKAEFEDLYISINQLGRDFATSHPWSLQGGAAPKTASIIDAAKSISLDDVTCRIGICAVLGLDDAMLFPNNSPMAQGRENQLHSIIQGIDIRDYKGRSSTLAWYPYSSSRNLRDLNHKHADFIPLWNNRRLLEERATFSGGTYLTDNRPWFEWHQFPKDAGTSPLTLTYADVATHNHITLDHNGNLFSRTAPIIKLPSKATLDDHLNLLGLLSSSTACFWLKQNSHNKGSTVDSKGARTTLAPWEDFYQFSGTTLKKYPLPEGRATERARRIDDLARELAKWEPSAVFVREAPSHEVIESAEHEHTRIRKLMIAEQEELDWAVYYLYGLTERDYSLPLGTVDGISLGTRPFEIALARKVDAGEAGTSWFDRHHSTPTTEIPSNWDSTYREAVQERLDLIDSDKSIRLLEAPEYKRRWADDLWEDKVNDALQDWLLTRLESPELWRREDGMPQPRTIAELASIIETSEEFSDVLQALSLWSNRRDASVTKMLEDLLKNEAVPYLKGLRYKPSGLRKRAEWEATWDAQRREDAGEITAEEVPVPPNYTSADMFPASWRHRGKLDVPKERFISYPGASPSGDPSTMLGWAGWDDKDKGLAIMSLFHDRLDEDTDVDALASILNGLKEQLPWVLQWHNEMDPELGIRLGDYLQDQLRETAAGIHVPVEELDNYVPATTRARKRKK